MKKKITLILGLIPVVLFAQIPTLHWRFANVSSYYDTTTYACTFAFDVQVSCDMAGTFHSDIQLYFDYNTLAFGSNVVSNGNLTYERMELLLGDLAGTPLYATFGNVDNKPYRYAILSEATFTVANPMFMNEVPMLPTWAGYAHFEMKIQNPSELAGIQFVPDDGGVGLMNGGQYYLDASHPTATKYGYPPEFAVVIWNDLINEPLMCSIPDMDIAIIDIISPSTGNNLELETVKINLANYGAMTQSNIPVEYAVNDNAPVLEYVPGPLASYENIDYTFSILANLFEAGWYDITCCSKLQGDEIAYNNCQSKQIENIIINNPPGGLGCTPQYTAGCVNGNAITYFELEQISNTSDCDNTNGTGWSQYLDLGPAMIFPDNTYDFKFKCSGYNTRMSGWVDYNDDFILTEDEKIISNQMFVLPDQLYTVPVYFPANTAPGKHFMRLRTRYYSSVTDPCAPYQTGEAEDYFVAVGPFGSLEGYVYEFNSTTPIPNAQIQISSQTALSGADGYYQIIDVPSSTYSVICTSDGFENDTVTGVQITGNVTTSQNFYLKWAELTTNPEQVVVTVSPDGQTDFDLQLINSGTAPLFYHSMTQYQLDIEDNGNEEIITESNLTDVTGDVIIDINAQAACNGASLNGVAYADGYFYVSGYLPDGGGNKIFKLDMDGNLIQTYDQPTTSEYGMRDLVTSGYFLLGGDELGFYWIDLATGNPITCFAGNLGIGCNRGCDVPFSLTQPDIFILNWTSSIVKCDFLGNIAKMYAPSGLTGQFGLTSIGNDKMLIFDQNGSQTNRAIIHEYDLITESLTGNQIPLPMLPGASYQQAAGLFYTTQMFPGKAIVGGILQSSPYDRIFAIELPDLEGWLSITAGGNGSITGVTDGSATMTLHFDASGLEAGASKSAWISIFSNDRYNPVLNIPVTMLVDNINVQIKAFLEGPFAGTAMLPYLNFFGQIPFSQPYNAPPWNYTGTESVNSIPNNDVVDWVLVELRDAPDAQSAVSSTMIGQQAGFIIDDGNISGLDGSNNLQFNVVVNQNLFAVLWHRNHIGIMSALPLDKTENLYSYDFTDGVNKVFGGSLGHKQIGVGIWGMAGGDGSADGQVNNTDKNDVWVPQSGSSGYLSGDFTMDGQVNNVDKNDVWSPNGGSGSQVPDNTKAFMCMVPE